MTRLRGIDPGPLSQPQSAYIEGLQFSALAEVLHSHRRQGNENGHQHDRESKDKCGHFKYEVARL